MAFLYKYVGLFGENDCFRFNCLQFQVPPLRLQVFCHKDFIDYIRDRIL